MKYQIYFKARAIKNLKKISKEDAKKITAKIKEMENNLQGDVKKLTKHTHEYRLRVGDWRILFETEINKIVIYKIKHRRDAYR
ncbi:MAG: type II toxin-antitoxin system RelE/ParE family toxin [Candidatus Scalindua sp.]|jgi:mRNA interferase RelE/StbE|nr:type II toxin-antitoxin system RelE/ParE family toxin [Candidatus Scalindua sp.]